MPRPPVDARWRELVREVHRRKSNLGAGAIRRELIAEGWPDNNDLPSPRTIGRILAEFRVLPPEEQRQYDLFFWPAAMERGDLPWEASRYALELVKLCDLSGRGQPLVREAKWFWRVSLAAPDALPELRYKAAWLMVGCEAMHEIGVPEQAPKAVASAVACFLALAPWKGDPASSARYHEITQVSHQVLTLDQSQEIVSTVIGGYYKAKQDQQAGESPSTDREEGSDDKAR